MKKSLLLGVALLAVNANLFSQTVLFEDSFETYTDFAISNVGAWTLIDVDLKNTYGFQGVTFLNSGSPKSFQVFNANSTTPIIEVSEDSDWTARTGDKFMVCFAASGATPLNNDWLISPQVTLGSAGNVLTFWAKSCDANYGFEKFKVGISSGNTTANVTLLSTGTVITASDATWAQYTYAVPASFNSQAVYFSINCVSNDQFGFGVDDFKVTTTDVASADSFFANNFSMYPNPVANELNIAAKTNNTINAISIVDMNGRTVKNTNDAGVNNTSVNVSDLNAGVYFVTIETNEGTGTSKFIKK